MSGSAGQGKPAREFSWSNDRLVRECLKGNEEAWGALINRYKNLIYSIPLKYGFPQEDAADIFQAVCMELLTELPRLREPNALAGWLIQVTSHTCLRWKRQQGRLPPADEADAAQLPATENSTQETILLEAEQEQVLREALVVLTPRCRRLVHMLFFEIPARPYEDVAASLGLAPGSIGFIRGRCLEKLRRRLQEMGFE